MSGLAKYLEDEGLSTVIVALVREHALAMAPPRALWVPFPLGRPFGVPGDPAFQARVLGAALALLERDRGPVLDDFPEDAPDQLAGDGEGWVCPVRFAAPASDDGDQVAAILREIAELAPWYEMARQRRGRTTVGLSGLSPEAMARYMAGWLDGRRESPVDGASPADALRLASEDLKAFYFEAATAQPGSESGAVVPWFWRETRAAELIRALRRLCLADPDPAIYDLGDFMLVPGAYRD